MMLCANMYMFPVVLFYRVDIICSRLRARSYHILLLITSVDEQRAKSRALFLLVWHTKVLLYQLFGINIRGGQWSGERRSLHALL
jgi:hypothetical protein